MVDHPVVSRAEWLAARRALLAREKQETRLRDAVNAERLALPWVRVDEPYRFDTPAGECDLAALFEGRSQLVVYHFMLAPGWAVGCPGCSFLADSFDGTLAHLNHHDVTLTAVSRAPLDEIEAYRRRMGWRFPWASSHGSDFNYDFGASFRAEDIAAGTAIFNYGDALSPGAGTEQPGLSSFVRGEDGAIYHSYSSFARGLETLIGTLMILDRAPRGRNERSTMDFVRRHDEYAAPRDRPCHAHA